MSGRAAVAAIAAVAAETALDDLEGQEVLPLLAQYPAQPVDVFLVELSVAGRRSLGVEETLALQEPDLRDGDVRKLTLQQGQHVPDREIRSLRQAPTPYPSAAPAR